MHIEWWPVITLYLLCDCNNNGIGVVTVEDWVSAKTLAKEIELAVSRIRDRRQAALKRLVAAKAKPKPKPKAKSANPPLRRMNAFLPSDMFARPIDPPQKVKAAHVNKGSALVAAGTPVQET